MISPSLNDIFQKSILYAKDLRHEYLTIEHVFYILLSSQQGADIISICGGNIGLMKEALEKYIKTNIDTLPQEINQDPFESIALSRLIDNMIQHIQSAQKQSADVGDLIAALYDETNTFIYKLLNEYNISRLDILEVISHTEEEALQTKEKTKSFLQKYTE